MQWYFAKDKTLLLDDGDYHHIKKVMRMSKGDIIKVVFDSSVYTCELTDVDKDVVFKTLNEEKYQEEELSITLAFSLIKEQHLNYLIQKSTEVGVTDFIPIITNRSVVKVDDKKESGKIERWSRICKEASEQSHRFNIPKFSKIKSLKSICNTDHDIKLLCSLNENTKNIKKVLQKIDKCVKILIVVGPEGGFDSSEEQLLVDNGFECISLGNNVMRAETAPVSVISMINYEFMG